MTINELQDNVIEEFSAFDDWMDKYALLIDLGNSLPPLEEKYKTESNLIEGCQSRVWLQADYEDGKIIFKGESDAVIVKGIVSLLINVLSGHTPQEILDTDLYFIEQIGLKEHLPAQTAWWLWSSKCECTHWPTAQKNKDNSNKKGMPTTATYLSTISNNPSYSVISVP